MVDATLKKCSRCKQEFSVSAFGTSWYCLNCDRMRAKKWRLRNSDKCKTMTKRYYQTHKSNQKDKVAKRRHANKVHIWKHLLVHPCVDCGEDDLRVLEFDHVKGEKINSISHMSLMACPKIEQEIEKCEVRCANCHARKTHYQRGYAMPPKVQYTWVEVP